MLGKWVRLATVIAVASMIVGPGMVLAAASGAGPDDALAPTGEWMTLEKDQSHWYSFGYDGQEGQITVRMDVEPNDGANFRVVTPRQIAEWRDTGEITGCGCGGENDYESADLVWSGNFNTPGTYYLEVRHTGSRPTPSYYTVTVGGDGVFFTAPKAKAEAEEVRAVVAAPQAEEAVAEEAAIGDWNALAVGQEAWFEFYYSGRDSKIEITLDATPDSSAVFSVWTSEQVRLRNQGEKVSPVGAGAENAFMAGDLSWAGSFAGPGTFYVRVEQRGAVPASYLLDIKGDDVIF